MTEAIILAGGFGTRLRPVVSDLPKSMAPVNGRPFLEFLLDDLLKQGIRKAVLSVGYKHEYIISHFGYSYKDMELDYAIEQEPLGTGGGIRLALWKVESPCVAALNGDSLFRVDLKEMHDVHVRHKADVTIALRKLNDTGRYGRVVLKRNKRIARFAEKQDNTGPGFINGGVYLIEKLFLMDPGFRGQFSIEKDCFETMAPEARLFGFPSDAYFLDIGIPEDFYRAQKEFTTL